MIYLGICNVFILPNYTVCVQAASYGAGVFFWEHNSHITSCGMIWIISDKHKRDGKKRTVLSDDLL